MKQKLYVAAIIGWLFTFVLNLISAFGVDIAERFPLVWIFFLTMFVLVIPTLFLAKNHPNIVEELDDMDDGIPLRPFFQDVEPWLGALVFVSVALAIAAFCMGTTQGYGQPEIVDGKFVLMKDSILIRTIPADEYTRMKAGKLQIFSGVSLIFYALCILILRRLIRWGTEKVVG
ncbi:MAG: hypothetical protein EOO50_02670 [Flavobacterium sp.]|uniref:hypothetical protein n=1 Tax=Flavobacterium sp. TaxID=239 RepID=UPI0011F4C0F8|nr:hypothetical protein [Flavobacterium sp.]RZJ68342.1 MAG: hypothetical protein EOO50_02670 [Flavobacterium sp.]